MARSPRLAVVAMGVKGRRLPDDRPVAAASLAAV